MQIYTQFENTIIIALHKKFIGKVKGLSMYFC